MRLVDRLDVNGFATGAVQYFSRGRWTPVCSFGFDENERAVACRQLGLSNDSGGRKYSASVGFKQLPDAHVAEIEDVRDSSSIMSW